MCVRLGGQLATSTLPRIMKALEVIALGLHKDVYSNDVTSAWVRREVQSGG